MVQLVQLAVAALALLANGVAAQRQRKAWRDFTKEEKDRYKAAVISSMRSGLHFQFAEAHASDPNHYYGHNNCGFLLWHRKFLLAYENMLRDQGEEFKDVTLPYWNYFHDSTRQVARGNPCETILECSQFLTDMGGLGDTPGHVQIIPELGQAFGTCAEDWLSEHACASPDGKSNCGCIPRGPWKRKPTKDKEFQNFLQIVQSTTVGAVGNLRKGAIRAGREVHSKLSVAVEGTFHNMVHNQLGFVGRDEEGNDMHEGVMSTLASPFDPVFYGHHTTVDLVHYVHNHCYYRDAGPKSIGKFKVFDKCEIEIKGKEPVNVTITPNSEIHLKSNYQKVNDYFNEIGQTYNDFADATDLGEFSYTYVFDDWINDFLKRNNIVCPAHNAKHHHRHHHHHHRHHHDDDREDEACHKIEEPVAAMNGALSKCINDVKVANDFDITDAANYVGYVECEIIRQKQGYDHNDYSPSFRKAFNMGDDVHKYCFEVSQALPASEVASKVPESCRRELSDLTDTDLLDGFGKKLPCKEKNSEFKHSRHIHIKVHKAT